MTGHVAESVVEVLPVGLGDDLLWHFTGPGRHGVDLVVLGDWARQRRRAVAWLSLDEGDNDPARFWRHVVAALDRVRPGVAERVVPLLGPPAPPSFEGLVTALINELAAQPDQLLLVLDDYHLIQAHQVHAALAFLLEHQPPGLQLVLASRTDPPLPLARLRARGQLVELRAADLRFTAEEAAALLRAAVGPDLPDGAVAALAARTEGWVAGLQLAGLSLRGQADVAGFVTAFSGSHRYVLDFLAEVAYQRNDLDAALEEVVEGIARCRQLAHTQPLATGLATLGWIRQAQGDPAGAKDAMDEALRVAPSQNVASLLNPVPALRARLLLAQGDIVAAAGWTTQRGLGADDEPSYPREPKYLVLARVLLAQELPDRALGLLERLHASAVAQDRTGSLIQIQALRALALAASGEQAGSVAALAEALTLASPQGYVRVFADEGPPMRALLGRLAAAKRTDQTIARTVPLGYLSRLVRAFERDATPVVPGLVEPLSPRELEVARLVATGRPNQQIAEELVVAPNTVKKHVTHILEKLGAANRTEATTRARELGLLP